MTRRGVRQPHRQGRSAPRGARSSTSSATSTACGPPCCAAPPSGAATAVARRSRRTPARTGGRIIDLLYDGLTAPDSRAIETLRAALPRDGAELERLYPQTAAELQSWGRSWIEACQTGLRRCRRRSRTGPRGRLVHPGRDAGPRLRAPTRLLLRPRYGKAWPDQRHCDVRASCANAVRRTVIMAFRCATRHGSRKPPNPSRPTKAGLPHHV